MSLTKDQWNLMLQWIPRDKVPEALRVWNSAMRTVEKATRDKDTIERMTRSSNTAAKASQVTTPPICTLPTPDVSKSNLDAQIEILELMVLEMQRTGKPYTNRLADVPTILKNEKADLSNSPSAVLAQG